MKTRPTGHSETYANDDDSPLIERTYLASGTVLAGRYRIRELIGEGGMGDVYLATHLAIDKAVAIKVLAPEQMRRPRTVIRFLKEAKSASKIRHENVVDINDYGESDGRAFFVMEYLEGEDLSALVKREGRQPWSRVKPIIIQLLEGLGAAHAVGIVHRDIKPHNCFITVRQGRPDFVKVIDFGIAKLAEGSDEQLTQTGAIMGTADYMSPEQGMGAELDGRSDLYSVGVILYRLLTGSVPYKGSNPMSILFQHIHAPRVPPSEACPEAGIGPQLDALVLKALARDRDDRFASAEEFIAAIEAIDNDEQAAPSPAAGRRWRWIAGGALAVAIAAGVIAWQAITPDEPEPAGAGAIAPERPSPPAVTDEPEPDTAPAPTQPNEPAEPAGADPSGGVEDPATDVEAADTESDDPTAGPESDDEVILEDAEATTGLDEDEGPDRPLRRSTRAIHSRLARMNGKVRACGKKAGLFPGESVTVQLKIAPSGRVQSAKVMGAFSRKGARCIEQVIRGARFSAAQLSQTAEHRFTL